MIGCEKVMDSCAGQAFREDGEGSVSPALVIDVIHVSTPAPYDTDSVLSRLSFGQDSLLCAPGRLRVNRPMT